MTLFLVITAVAVLALVFRTKFLKFIGKTLGCLGLFLLLLVGGGAAFYWLAVDIELPKNTRLPEEPAVTADLKGLCTGRNWIGQNPSGLWDLYVEGDALQRGQAFGLLNKDLLYYQEKVFMDQIDNLVPNRKYQSLLKYFIKSYNRHLTDYVPQENLEEIYAMSQACSHEFDYVGAPYDRQLNFHAAHDLGHAMQDYMLVGCTSFAAWGKNSETGDVLVGRNFDFYMGDDFARNKEVAFFNPASGYKFAFVTWPGMTGVCSGMNAEGLTVTINAARSAMPTGSATPISLLARRILQYARTIAEAKAIADSTETFVSESLLIGSAADGRAAIIEKSVDHCALYQAPAGHHWLACANHYQSADFANDERNIENIRTSDSPTRLQRASDLVQQLSPLTAEKAVTVLRDKLGTDSAHIGLGNELALNQLLGHHSVVFNASQRLMWVSTSPWQEGAFVCYDLNRIFADPAAARGNAPTDSLAIAADTAFLASNHFKNYLRYRKLAHQLRQKGGGLNADEVKEMVDCNPLLFKAHELAGDASLPDTALALGYYRKALQLRVPKQMERERIEGKIEKILKK